MSQPCANIQYSVCIHCLQSLFALSLKATGWEYKKIYIFYVCTLLSFPLLQYSLWSCTNVALSELKVVIYCLCATFGCGTHQITPIDLNYLLFPLFVLYCDQINLQREPTTVQKTPPQMRLSMLLDLQMHSGPKITFLASQFCSLFSDCNANCKSSILLITWFSCNKLFQFI